MLNTVKWPINDEIIIIAIINYRVTHKGWDFRDDCTQFILYISLYLGFSATLKLFQAIKR